MTRHPVIIQDILQCILVIIEYCSIICNMTGHPSMIQDILQYSKLLFWISWNMTGKFDTMQDILQ